MTRYRILRNGELIQDGDEVDASRGPCDDAKWMPVGERMIGKPAPDPRYPSHRIYRRPDPESCESGVWNE